MPKQVFNQHKEFHEKKILYLHKFKVVAEISSLVDLVTCGLVVNIGYRNNQLSYPPSNTRGSVFKVTVESHFWKHTNQLLTRLWHLCYFVTIISWALHCPTVNLCMHKQRLKSVKIAYKSSRTWIYVPVTTNSLTIQKMGFLLISASDTYQSVKGQGQDKSKTYYGLISHS